jgi:DNA-binding transcriptional LysR family regulator
MDIELSIDVVHAPGIKEDQRNEDVDGALLGEPETELEATDADAIQLFDKEYAEAVRAGKPDDEADENEPQIRSPVRKSVLEMHHNPQIVFGLL